MTRVLVAPDTFKGTFTAGEVADAVAAGVEAGGLHADRCPVADGGEGTAAALARHAEAVWHEHAVDGPLGGSVLARFALLHDGRTAALDLAEASGLPLLAEDERDPLTATTRGTGQLIAAAVAAGARTVLIGSGGSATVDGGRGAIDALRAAGWARGAPPARLVVLCDVRTPWERAAEVFGPQKGATPAAVRTLAARLDAFAAELPRDPRGVPATGGSGGFSGGLWAAFDAELRPGAAFVLDAVGFDERARAAVAVVVGEGRLDATTAEGKAAGEAVARAAALGVPCHAIAGRSDLDAAAVRELGLASVREASSLGELRDAGRALAVTVRRG